MLSAASAIFHAVYSSTVPWPIHTWAVYSFIAADPFALINAAPRPCVYMDSHPAIARSILAPLFPIYRRFKVVCWSVFLRPLT